MIKKGFKKIISTCEKFKTVLLVSVFAIFVPFFVSANFVYDAIVKSIIFIFKVPYYITIYPAIWMADLLGYVTGGDFIKFCYSCGTNPAVAAGLPITQGIANIILILVLLVVIVGIILELNEYGSKKMFVKLLIVALLINFAPLLVGLIVDGSNIIMNYFVDGIGDDIDAIKSTISGDGGKLILEEIDKEGKGTAGLTERLLVPVALLLMQAFINVVMIFVLFLYVLLYICRYVAIWIITILSPIAFVCMIHPTTQKLWKDWFKQLIQWSLVGATGAFFLYLSLRVNFEIRTAYETAGVPIEGESFISDVFSSILPLLMVAILAVMGYILAIKTSALGTDKIINFGQSTRKRTVAWGAAAGAGGYALGKYGAKHTGKKAEEKWTGFQVKRNEKLANDQNLSADQRANFTRRAEIAKAKQERIKGELGDKTKEKVSKLSPERQKEDLLKELNKSRPNAKKVKALEDATNLTAKNPGKARAVQEALDPEKVKRIVAQHGEEGANRRLTADAVRKSAPSTFRENIDKDSLSNIDVFHGMDSRKITEIGEKGSSEQKEALRNNVYNNRAKIRRETRRLIIAGRHAEATALRNKMNSILNNPDYNN